MEAEQALCRCVTDSLESPNARTVLGKFKALNQTPSFELHREPIKRKKHRQGGTLMFSAVDRIRRSLAESKDSTSEI